MTRIYFDEPEDSIELAKALEAAGYTVETVREAFAGEDDSDDHAWVLEVAQADDRITEMVDIDGGWLCGDERLAVEPLPLPNEPKRLKG
jgi:hypothetical protein